MKPKDLEIELLNLKIDTLELQLKNSDKVNGYLNLINQELGCHLKLNTKIMLSAGLFIAVVCIIVIGASYSHIH